MTEHITCSQTVLSSWTSSLKKIYVKFMLDSIVTNISTLSFLDFLLGIQMYLLSEAFSLSSCEQMWSC